LRRLSVGLSIELGMKAGMPVPMTMTGGQILTTHHPEERAMTPDWQKIRELEESVQWRDAELIKLRAELASTRTLTDAERAVATLDELYVRYLNVLARNQFDAAKAFGQAFNEVHAKASEQLLALRAREKAE
jgi:hypothetical protein